MVRSGNHPQRLSGLWNWLPVFRVVAETQHLPTASRRLQVSASSLCRTIQNLEDAVGKPLFRRLGRRLELNDAGERLLAAVANGMSEIGEAVSDVADGALAGPLRISAPGAFVPVYVLPAMAQVLGEHDRLIPDVTCLEAGPANERLVDGRLDVALLDDPEPHPSLCIERLRAIHYGVYCGLRHPLAGAATVRLEDILPHRFVAPPTKCDDHWPPDMPRVVGFHVGRLDLGLELCASDGYLAVLPDEIVRARDPANRLRRLPLDIFPDTALHAVYRERPEMPRRTEALLAALRQVTRA